MSHAPPPPRIYLDNGATSWPKPEEVYAAVERYQRELGAPAGRSSYSEAAIVSQAVADVRLQLARLLGVDDASRVIFTANGSDSLNLAIHGLLRDGDHVITSVIEHNSVLRPLAQWEHAGRISVTRVACDGQGYLDPDDVRAALRPESRLVAISHASNVTGALQPIADISRIAHAGGATFCAMLRRALVTCRSI
jgi:cysteine desulfurase/selenocysteine lyase